MSRSHEDSGGGGREGGNMDYKEATEWLKGNRSMTNIIPQDPFETWQVRIAEADAAMTQQSYWIVRAEAEKLVKPAKHPK